MLWAFSSPCVSQLHSSLISSGTCYIFTYKTLEIRFAYACSNHRFLTNSSWITRNTSPLELDNLQPPTTMAHISALPNEIILQIISYLKLENISMKFDPCGGWSYYVNKLFQETWNIRSIAHTSRLFHLLCKMEYLQHYFPQDGSAATSIPTSKSPIVEFAITPAHLSDVSPNAVLHTFSLPKIHTIILSQLESDATKGLELPGLEFDPVRSSPVETLYLPQCSVNPAALKRILTLPMLRKRC